MSSARVETLRNELGQLEGRCRTLRRELNAEVQLVQRTCPHQTWRAERDGDCHKPGYYYTCKDCGYTLNYLPRCATKDCIEYV